MKKVFFLLIGGLLLSIQTFAQSSGDAAPQNPIDVRYQACLNLPSNETTVGMIECAHAAADAWNAELENDYKLLMSKLSPDGQKSLERAQRAWVEYREKESSFSGTLYYSEMDGTMWHTTNADRTYEIVRERALALEAYLHDFDLR